MNRCDKAVVMLVAACLLNSGWLYAIVGDDPNCAAHDVELDQDVRRGYNGIEAVALFNSTPVDPVNGNVADLKYVAVGATIAVHVSAADDDEHICEWWGTKIIKNTLQYHDLYVEVYDAGNPGSAYLDRQPLVATTRARAVTIWDGSVTIAAGWVGKQLKIVLVGNVDDVSPCTYPTRPSMSYHAEADDPAFGVDLFSAKCAVVKVELAFQTSGMGAAKVVPSPDYQRIGVLKGDTLTFKTVLTPSVVLPNGEYSWSGEKNGNGSSISVTFNNLGMLRTETVQVVGVTRTATITVVDVPEPDENTWAIWMTTLHGPGWVLKINNLASEALAWAQANQAALGGGLHNGKADAARHAYWNVLMIIEGYSPADAWGAGQSHERSNIVAGDPHNETAMDLENNQKGINMGAGLTTRASGQAAVINALTNGNLTYFDDLANSGECGLLQPTNK